MHVVSQETWLMVQAGKFIVFMGIDYHHMDYSARVAIDTLSLCN
jgi:hypothetical protein